MATKLTEGNYYVQTFADGDAIYILVGARLKNGFNRTVYVESFHRVARQSTTTNLTPSQWTPIAGSQIPTTLYRKIYEHPASGTAA